MYTGYQNCAVVRVRVCDCEIVGLNPNHFPCWWWRQWISLAEVSSPQIDPILPYLKNVYAIFCNECLIGPFGVINTKWLCLLLLCVWPMKGWFGKNHCSTSYSKLGRVQHNIERIKVTQPAPLEDDVWRLSLSGWQMACCIRMKTLNLRLDHHYKD